MINSLDTTHGSWQDAHIQRLLEKKKPSVALQRHANASAPW